MNGLVVDAINLVEELNDKFQREDNSDYLPYEFIYHTYYGNGIKFMGVLIWDFDNDQRRYDYEKDDYEPLKDFIIRESKRISNELSNFIKPNNSGYISVKDYLPCDDTDNLEAEQIIVILGYKDNSTLTLCGVWKNNAFYCLETNEVLDNVIYWMKLPKF